MVLGMNVVGRTAFRVVIFGVPSVCMMTILLGRWAQHPKASVLDETVEILTVEQPLVIICENLFEMNKKIGPEDSSPLMYYKDKVEAIKLRSTGEYKLNALNQRLTTWVEKAIRDRFSCSSSANTCCFVSDLYFI